MADLVDGGPVPVNSGPEETRAVEIGALGEPDSGQALLQEPAFRLR
jgi:hypothetical protein